MPRVPSQASARKELYDAVEVAAVGVVTLLIAAAATIASTTPAGATDIEHYTDSDRPVFYGQRLVLDHCSRVGPLGLPQFLWVKVDDDWTKQATATNHTSAQCPDAAPYLHTYRWTVDVPDALAPDLRVLVELGYGHTPSTSHKFVVPEYPSKAAMTQHLQCLLAHGGHAAPINTNC